MRSGRKITRGQVEASRRQSVYLQNQAFLSSNRSQQGYASYLALQQRYNLQQGEGQQRENEVITPKDGTEENSSGRSVRLPLAVLTIGVYVAICLMLCFLLLHVLRRWLLQ